MQAYLQYTTKNSPKNKQKAIIRALAVAGYRLGPAMIAGRPVARFISKAGREC